MIYVYVMEINPMLCEILHEGHPRISRTMSIMRVHLTLVDSYVANPETACPAYCDWET